MHRNDVRFKPVMHPSNISVDYENKCITAVDVGKTTLELDLQACLKHESVKAHDEFDKNHRSKIEVVVERSRPWVERSMRSSLASSPSTMTFGLTPNRTNPESRSRVTFEVDMEEPRHTAFL